MRFMLVPLLRLVKNRIAAPRFARISVKKLPYPMISPGYARDVGRIPAFYTGLPGPEVAVHSPVGKMTS